MIWPRPLLVLQLFLRASRVQRKRAVLTVAAPLSAIALVQRSRLRTRQ